MINQLRIRIEELEKKIKGLKSRYNLEDKAKIRGAR